jgi:hypothetical protein
MGNTDRRRNVFGGGLALYNAKCVDWRARRERGLVLCGGELEIAVGTHIAMRPPHKAVRAAFPHTASTLGI